MVRWTQEQAQDYLGKLKATLQATRAWRNGEEPDPGPESKLQGKIEDWARTHGFPCLSFPQTQKVKRFLPAGWPDVVLVLPRRVLFLELKSAGGRMRREQEEMHRRFLFLGWRVFKIRSYKKFLELVEV